MLSYRHAFHAGNHADVLKHATLCLLLESLVKKEKPFTLIDTHAGAGLYALDDERAEKTGETRAGITRLLEAVTAASHEAAPPMPAALAPYLARCREYAAHGTYPGSPELMRGYLRAGDQLHLVELHNTEIDVLRANMKNAPRSSAAPQSGTTPRNTAPQSGATPRNTAPQVHIHHRDACQAVSALTPPEPRRGLLLMDPSYEVDSDYTNVSASLVLCHKRWPVGVLCLWYPLLKRRESETATLLATLRECAAQSGSSFLRAELLVDTPDREAGLYGSGMAIINPTWCLDDQLRELLPYLQAVLAPQSATDTASPAPTTQLPHLQAALATQSAVPEGDTGAAWRLDADWV